MITNPNARTTYTGNGTQTEFPFYFRIPVELSGGVYFPRDSYDIAVYVNDVKKTYITDYVFSLSATGLGKVVFNSPPANGQEVNIVRWNYAFLSLSLPENSNQKNSFITLITSGMFCYNRNEVFSILDKYKDKWQPVNSLTYNAQWFNDYSTDKNPESSTDFEKAIDDYETYVGKDNIKGFTFHVPWYWIPSNDNFEPLNSVIPVLYEGGYDTHLYKKEKDEGEVYYDSTARNANSVYTVGYTIIVTLANHGFKNGYTVQVAQCAESIANGTFTIYDVTTNTFTYTIPGGTYIKGSPKYLGGTTKISCRQLVNTSGDPLISNPYNPVCGGTAFGALNTMPTINGVPIFGGTPDDAGLRQALEYVDGKGYKFIFYSFTEVADVTKPWRGNLLPTIKTIPQFLDQIKDQCIYYAQKLVDWNVKPYAFVTCSEMKEINRHKTYSSGGQYTDDTDSFDFTAIEKWKEIYDEVKAIFDGNGWTDVLVGYSADWSELNGFTDDQGYYWRQLDELMAYQDAVFIDAYYGITEQHTEVYQDYLDGWTEGRDYDYYITDYDDWKDYIGGTAAITSQEYRLKDLDWWYRNSHDHVGKSPGYVRTPTPWVPESKKIIFTELGCPSIDSGSSEPNLFYDPDAVQGGVARGSELIRKDIVQYYYLKSAVVKMNDGTLPVAGYCIWQGDSRPLNTLECLGAFFWGDSYRVPFVHWLKYLTDYWKLMFPLEIGISADLDTTETNLSLAELYKITFSPAEDTLETQFTAYFTNHNKNIVYKDNTYIAIPIRRDKVSANADLQINGVDITVGVNGITFGGNQYTLAEIIERDWIKRAHIWISLIDWQVLKQDRLLFEGFITDIVSFDQGSLTVGCRSVLDRLNDAFPKIAYTELCPHDLYDARCLVNKSSYKSIGAVTESENNFTISSPVFNYSSFSQGYWEGGEIRFTSGNNQYVKRGIKKHNDGSIVVRKQFPETIEVGDDFEAWAGCDKTSIVCDTRFSNYDNFLGFEYIPRPETIYGL